MDFLRRWWQVLVIVALLAMVAVRQSPWWALALAGAFIVVNVTIYWSRQVEQALSELWWYFAALGGVVVTAVARPDLPEHFYDVSAQVLPVLILVVGLGLKPTITRALVNVGFVCVILAVSGEVASLMVVAGREPSDALAGTVLGSYTFLGIAITAELLLRFAPDDRERCLPSGGRQRYDRTMNDPETLATTSDTNAPGRLLSRPVPLGRERAPTRRTARVRSADPPAVGCIFAMSDLARPITLRRAAWSASSKCRSSRIQSPRRDVRLHASGNAPNAALSASSKCRSWRTGRSRRDVRKRHAVLRGCVVRRRRGCVGPSSCG